MADLVTQRATLLPCDDVIVRAVQFFATENWRPTSQSARTATFQGKPPIPWFMLLLTALGFVFCIVPGVIMYFMVIRKMYRFQNLVVTASSIPGGSEVVVRYPKHATRLTSWFLDALPILPAMGQPAPAPWPGLPSLSAPADSGFATQGVPRICRSCGGAAIEQGSEFCADCGARQ